MEEEQVSKINGKIREDLYTVVEIDEKSSFLIEKGYGIYEKDVLYLEPTETLYLVYKGILEVFDDSKKYSFIELLEIFSEKDPLIWMRLNLYSNLRKRGFIVRKGIGGRISFFVEKKFRENVKRYLVEGVSEGIRIGFVELENLFRRSLESGRVLILAVIDKEGNITYYMVNKLSSVEGYGEKISNID